MRIVRVTMSIVTLVAFVGAMCVAQEASTLVTVKNPSKLRRPQQVVAVVWVDIAKQLGKDVAAVAVTDKSTNQVLVSQLFDSDLDGKIDALLFQSDFLPGQSKSFLVSESAKPGEFTSLVDARYIEPREDLAWENDRIAFRMYGPALAAEVNNGIDVWTKRVRYLIVKKWYEGEEQTPKIVYHIDHGEGADFFNVGRSLGCGGSGLWIGDKVAQPGVFDSYRIIATGPIRTCFELTYNKWSVGGSPLKETKRITLDAGQNLNRVEVTFVGSPGKLPLALALGLVKRPNTTMRVDKASGWMSLWGPVNDSLPNGYLGTGIVFSPGALVQTTEDSAQYIVVERSRVGSTFTYHAGAGWTRSGDFNDAADWNVYLAQQASLRGRPLKVAVGPSKRNAKH